MVQEISPGIQRFADFPYQVTVGNDVRLAFPEIIGYEPTLLELCDRNSAQFELEAIARNISADSQIFFNIYALWIDEAIDFPNHILLCLEDVTEIMRLRQDLIHRSNEMQLLLHQVSSSKDYTDKILASMTDLLIVTTALGRIKTVNRAVESLLGYTDTELHNQSISKIIGDQQILPNIHEYGSNSEFEITCLSKEGNLVMLSFSCTSLEVQSKNLPSSIRNSMGSSINYDLLYVGRKINPEELALRQSHSLSVRLNLLLEHLQIGILFEDEVGRLMFINPCLCQMMSISTLPKNWLGTEAIQATEAWRSQFIDPDYFVGRVQSLVASRQQVFKDELLLVDGKILQRDYTPISLEGSAYGHLWQFHELPNHSS
jgi:PAS domain S-box-containing protein